MNNQSFPNAMHEALRLTRAGQLHDATALIQHSLQGPLNNAAGSPVKDPSVIEGEYEHHDETSQTAAETTPGEPSKPDWLRSFGQKLDQWRTRLADTRPSGRAQPLPAGAQFLAQTYRSTSGHRHYKLYIPSAYSADSQGWPLLVMLHGCRQNPDDFAAGTRMNELAETHRCLVLYPAQSHNGNRLGCWNWFEAAHQQRNQGEPALLSGMIRAVVQDYSVDPKRVYIAGLSAGGAMAAVMGVAYPELFAAVGVHSGLAYGAAQDLPSALAAMRQGGAGFRALSAADVLPRLIVFHGAQDNIVHPRNAEQLIQQWQGTDKVQTQTERREAGGRTYTHRRTVDQHGVNRLEYWHIQQADHAWSGGSSKGSFTDPQGPDASQEMLRFFEQETVPCN